MPKLLVVDDNVEILSAMMAYGKARGFDVARAVDGREALSIAEAEQPDVILLDVHMPGLDGRDVMAALRQSDRLDNPVVIFVTGRASQSDRLVGLELGAHDYETKPIQLGRLFDKIDRFLDKRAAGEL